MSYSILENMNVLVFVLFHLNTYHVFKWSWAYSWKFSVWSCQFSGIIFFRCLNKKHSKIVSFADVNVAFVFDLTSERNHVLPRSPTHTMSYSRPSSISFTMSSSCSAFRHASEPTTSSKTNQNFMMISGLFSSLDAPS